MLDEGQLSVSWRELQAGREFLGLTIEQLWLSYFSLGGCGSAADVQRWLHGDRPLPDVDHNCLAAALNDEFLDRDLGRPVRYTDDDR